jgi:hypothetical protein
MILKHNAALVFLLSVVVAAAGFSQVEAPAVPAAPLGVAMVANSADSITLAWYRAPNNDAKA